MKVSPPGLSSSSSSSSPTKKKAQKNQQPPSTTQQTVGRRSPPRWMLRLSLLAVVAVYWNVSTLKRLRLASFGTNYFETDNHAASLVVEQASVNNNNNNNGAVNAPLQTQTPNQTATATTTTTIPTTATTNQPTQNVIQDFVKQPGVVIVLKMHGHPATWDQIQQAVCLFNMAYNHRPQYDIVVFTSLPVVPTTDNTTPDNNLFASVAAPANIRIVHDTLDIADEIKALSPTQIRDLTLRCQVQNTSDISFWSECHDTPNLRGRTSRLAYNWQAEFRSKYIWTHPALQDYRYMVWLDSDSFCTRVWEVDPVAIFLRHRLVLLFDNLVGIHQKQPEVHDRIVQSFNKTLCGMELVDGHLAAKGFNDTCHGRNLAVAHGFMHISDLDFYRSSVVQQWLHNHIGAFKWQRRFDDQVAMTVPAAILEPERSWDAYSHNITLDIYHNTAIDGKRDRRVGGFLKYWRTTVKEQFPEAVERCEAHIKVAN